MSLDQTLRQQIEQLLSTGDDQGSRGPRLTGDAVRLWQRVQKFLQLGLIAAEPDADALELACYALQLPTRQGRGVQTPGKLVRTNLKDRCEQSAELLVSLMGGQIDEPLLDRTTRLLHEMPQRSPMIDEGRILADAVNLDDFGIIGLLQQSMQLSLQGDGVTELADGLRKREQYGYWEARLKDGFHFEPIQRLAATRLATARQVAAQLENELNQDRPT